MGIYWEKWETKILQTKCFDLSLDTGGDDACALENVGKRIPRAKVYKREDGMEQIIN